MAPSTTTEYSSAELMQISRHRGVPDELEKSLDQVFASIGHALDELTGNKYTQILLPNQASTEQEKQINESLGKLHSILDNVDFDLSYVQRKARLELLTLSERSKERLKSPNISLKPEPVAQEPVQENPIPSVDSTGDKSSFNVKEEPEEKKDAQLGEYPNQLYLDDFQNDGLLGFNPSDDPLLNFNSPMFNSLDGQLSTEPGSGDPKRDSSKPEGNSLTPSQAGAEVSAEKSISDKPGQQPGPGPEPTDTSNDLEDLFGPEEPEKKDDETFALNSKNGDMDSNLTSFLQSGSLSAGFFGDQNFGFDNGDNGKGEESRQDEYANSAFDDFSFMDSGNLQ